MKQMQNSDPITWQIVKNIEINSMFSLNKMENSPKAFSGHLEIYTSVLQDIGPLGPLPCSHSTSPANHSKQGIGYR